jgi:DNA-binding NarL/FixJ family response regulator
MRRDIKWRNHREDASNEPDLIILDVYVPKVDGFSAAKQIKKILPTVPIIMLSMQDSLELIQAAQPAGAQGFVTKIESPPFY